MRRRNPLAGVLALLVLASALALGALTVGAVGSGTAFTDYTVLIEAGSSPDAAAAAVSAAGGTVLGANAAVGTLTARAPAAGFVNDVSASSAVVGAARVRPIGRLSATTPADGTAAATNSDAEPDASAAAVGLDPLDADRWNLPMVRSDEGRAVQAGDSDVMVGVLDSGVDATHPDIAPNIDVALSRNFATDIPTDPNGEVIDGPCEFPGCVDPPAYDDNGHGTHVAGIIAAAANGFGTSGVAPGVTIVSIRGGQDSGFVFLQPVLNALTYGADIGLDVINMSFYIDPWLYNCPNNPADSPEQQLEQRTTITAVNRALDYAHAHGVTLVGSLGNNHEDLGHPRPDTTSPDYPLGSEYVRTIDNATCRDLPVEGNHVIGVSALGPTTAKADYSNYGVEQISVSAPGGYFRDGLGTPIFRTNRNQILSTWPRNAAAANGWIDAAGNITPAGVAAAMVSDCSGGTCRYYRYIQGTSMASPHAVGVAALIVSEYGVPDPANPGLTLAPPEVDRILNSTASDHACPSPPLFSYQDVGRPAEFNALCEGTTAFNGFYGQGIVNALGAVTLTPAGLITGVQQDLEALAAGGSPELADKVEEVNDKLAAALAALGETPPDGSAALGNLKGATNVLEVMVRHGLLTADTGTALMGDLARAGRLLAEGAIADAIARDGRADKIADAQSALAAGDAHHAVGRYKDAVNSYKDAYNRAKSA